MSFFMYQFVCVCREIERKKRLIASFMKRSLDRKIIDAFVRRKEIAFHLCEFELLYFDHYSM